MNDRGVSPAVCRLQEQFFMADNYGPPPVQSPEHERLGSFIGTWHAEGQSYGQNQDRKDPRGGSESAADAVGRSAVSDTAAIVPCDRRAARSRLREVCESSRC